MPPVAATRELINNITDDALVYSGDSANLADLSVPRSTRTTSLSPLVLRCEVRLLSPVKAYKICERSLTRYPLMIPSSGLSSPQSRTTSRLTQIGEGAARRNFPTSSRHQCQCAWHQEEGNVRSNFYSFGWIQTSGLGVWTWSSINLVFFFS